MIATLLPVMPGAAGVLPGLFCLLLVAAVSLFVLAVRSLR